MVTEANAPHSWSSSSLVDVLGLMLIGVLGSVSSWGARRWGYRQHADHRCVSCGGIPSTCSQVSGVTVIACNSDPNVDPTGNNGDPKIVKWITAQINTIPSDGALFISEYEWYDRSTGTPAGFVATDLDNLALAVDAAGARGVNVHVLLDSASDPSVNSNIPAERVSSVIPGPFVRWNNAVPATYDKDISWFADCKNTSFVNRDVKDSTGVTLAHRADSHCDEANATHINHNKFFLWSDHGTSGPFHAILTSANIVPNAQLVYNNVLEQDGNTHLFNFLADYWWDMYYDAWGKQAASSSTTLPTATTQQEDITTAPNWDARVYAFPHPDATNDPIVGLLNNIKSCTSTAGGYPTWPDKAGRVWIAMEAIYDNRLSLNSYALLNAIQKVATTDGCPVRILLDKAAIVQTSEITDGSPGLSDGTDGSGGMLKKLRDIKNVQVIYTDRNRQLHDKLIVINADSLEIDGAGTAAWRHVDFIGSHNLSLGSLTKDAEAGIAIEQSGSDVSITTPSIGDYYGAAFEYMWNKCLAVRVRRSPS